jgi:hypothetical protein
MRVFSCSSPALSTGAPGNLYQWRTAMYFNSAIAAICVGGLLSFGALEGTAGIADAAKAKVEQTAKSKECSAQADAKGLHGKARKSFRSKCKRDTAT